MIYNISYKTLIDPKPLHIRFDKVDGFIWIYDGTIQLTLFGSEKYDTIYNRIRYVVSLKSGITYIFFSLFYKNQSWFFWLFAYRKNLDFT